MRGIVKYVCVGIIFFSGIKSYAQVVGLQLVDQENQNMFFSELRNSGNNGLEYADINGSPYYSDDFNLSDIYFKNGNIIKQTSVRLNLYKKTLEFQRDGEILEMIHMEDLDHVRINEEQIIFINDLHISKDEGFYKIELDGKYQLLQFLQVTFFDATEAKSFYEDDIPAEFKKQKDLYYLRLESNAPIAFGNKRNFGKVFDNDFPELVEFAKDNKLNPSKYNDLVLMVEFLNTL